MALISEDQRGKELAERKALFEAAESLSEDEKKALIEGLSVRDRLMRKRHSSKIKTTIEDQFGTFTIETRPMNMAEWDTGAALHAQFRASGANREEYRKTLDQMRVLLEAVTVTPGVDWKDPEIGDDVVLIVLFQTLTKTQRDVAEGIANFRGQ